MNPTKEHREQAQKMVDEFNALLMSPSLMDVEVSYSNLKNRITSALSSRDTEIREVLEGLSYFVTFSDGKKVRHWCARHETCSPACKAAAALYAKTGGEKENSENG